MKSTTLLAPLFLATLIAAECTPVTLSGHRRHHSKHHRKPATATQTLSGQNATITPLGLKKVHANSTNTGSGHSPKPKGSSGGSSHNVGRAPFINNIAVGFLPDDGAKKKNPLCSILQTKADSLLSWIRKWRRTSPVDESNR